MISQSKTPDLGEPHGRLTWTLPGGKPD